MYMKESKSMNLYIQDFVEMLLEGLKIGVSYQFKHNHEQKPIDNIVLLGLGGSGIGAEIALNYLQKEVQVPIVLCKDYEIPAFVNKNTLVVACSYSGNTEETLSAVSAAINNKASVVCITSGGLLGEVAIENSLDCLILPSGIPPRACFSCSLVVLLHVLNVKGVISDSFVVEIENAFQLLNEEDVAIKECALDIAHKIGNKLPVIYVDQNISGVGTRWRQQFNENSKILGWERPFPEMNHNELVGWRDVNNNLAVLFLHSGNELDAVKKRFQISKEVIQQYTNTVIDIYTKGNSFFDKVLYLILLGDWTSWYLAELRQVDAVEVNVIDYLKSELIK